MANRDDEPMPGYRKDGQPYAPNNTREDGSYVLGKNRPDPKHQFRKDDGRPRGRRAKGVKNLATEWNEELNRKITIMEGGVKKKITKRRSLIKTQIDRAMKSSDRAAETAFRYAEMSERREPTLQADDVEIIRDFLSGFMKQGDSSDDDLEPGADHDDSRKDDAPGGDPDA